MPLYSSLVNIKAQFIITEWQQVSTTCLMSQVSFHLQMKTDLVVMGDFSTIVGCYYCTVIATFKSTGQNEPHSRF